jgi:hypothetical protein
LKKQAERKPRIKTARRLRIKGHHIRTARKLGNGGKAKPVSPSEDEIITEVSRFARIGTNLIKVVLPLLRALGIGI